MMSVMSELNLQQREGAHSEFNAAKVVVATAATLVKDIFEQTWHARFEDHRAIFRSR